LIAESPALASLEAAPCEANGPGLSSKRWSWMASFDAVDERNERLMRSGIAVAMS